MKKTKKNKDEKIKKEIKKTKPIKLNIKDECDFDLDLKESICWYGSKKGREERR